MAEPLDIPLSRAGSRAYDMVRRVERFWIGLASARKEDFEVALYVASQFGVHRVASMSPQGQHVILVNVYSATDPKIAALWIPAENCSFMFEHFNPTPEKPNVIVGFGPAAED